MPLSRAFLWAWGPCGITCQGPGPLGHIVMVQLVHSMTALSRQAAAFCESRFLLLRITCVLSRQQLLTDKTRQTEDVIAASLHLCRLFFASVLLLHSSSSSLCESRKALKTEVPCKALTKVCAFRGVFGHKESSCHLGKQDTTIRLGLGLINWNQHESEFSSSGSQLQ